MKILIIGAGVIGGYFGARLHLLLSGTDITYLLRQQRKPRVDAEGLKIETTQNHFVMQPK